ncbi:MAG: hypothetical protein ABEI77_07090, partial [Halorientalis sp.]
MSGLGGGHLSERLSTGTKQFPINAFVYRQVWGLVAWFRGAVGSSSRSWAGMTRRLFVVLVLALTILSAGCSGLAGRSTQPSSPTATATASPTRTTRQPATTTTVGAEQTTTATPNGSAAQNQTPSGNSTHNQSRSLPKYAAMMRRLLESDDRNMTTLDTPLPDNTSLNTSMVDIKSISLEQYSPKTNDTRLRVEYYNTNDEGDGLNEIRVISLVYTHVMNKSLQNDDRISFDEVDIYSYANRSLNHPSARLKIDESWAAYYAIHIWDGHSSFNAITSTASRYRHGGYGDNPTLFKQRLKENAPENVTILRVEEYGAIVFVDYATVTPPEMTEKRATEIATLLKIYG